MIIVITCRLIYNCYSCYRTMATTTRHLRITSNLCFSRICETYLEMLMKAPGSTLHELTTLLEEFVYIENLAQEKYRFINIELNVKVMHITENIVHSSMVMCFRSDCLAEITLYKINNCRRCIAQISGNIGYMSFFTEKFADRCLEVLQDMKNLGQTVSIILSQFLSIYVTY